MSLFEELKRRNVFRVGIAYVLLGWAVLQGADFLLDLVGAPDWVIRTLAVIGLVGFPFALFFAWAFELTPEGIKREEEVDRSRSIAPQTGRKLNGIIIGLLVLVIVLMAVERLFFAGAGSPEVESGVTGVRKSIAVLPFADLSQAQDQEWFADGLAEEILNALVRVPDLQVAARTSSFAYKGTTQPISEIASELGVEHVLEGSVRSTDDRLRVTAQLIRASDGFHLWSQNYDREVADMIGIQEDLARSIATALETSMDPEALAEMAQVGTDSVEAYQEYLRGLQSRALANAYSVGQRLELTRKAYEHFEKARSIDSKFAGAHVQAARFWKTELTPHLLETGLSGLEPRQMLRNYNERIGKAIETASSEADRVRSLADRAEVDLRLREARQLYESYLDMRPNDEEARGNLVNVLLMMSDSSAARERIATWREGVFTDVNNAISLTESAWRGGFASEDAAAILDATRRWPNSDQLAYQAHRTMLWIGRNAEAEDLRSRYEMLVPGGHPVMRARHACLNGDRATAEQILKNLDPNGSTRLIESWLVLNYLGLVAEEEALLQPLVQSGVPYQMGTLLIYPQFDPRPYPELMAVLEREGVKRPPPVEPPFKCPPPAQPSVAVLPFVNMSADPEQEYFSDGMTEEIINALVRVPGLKVAARTSVFAFKGREQDVRAIGEALGVTHLVEGSVRSDGQQLRITAQLIQVGDGFHLWSETFDRPRVNVFSIQEEIAAAIAGELNEQLGDEAPRPEVARISVKAYDDYLRGRALLRERDEAGLVQARKLFEAVTAAHPDYAPGWASLAITADVQDDNEAAEGYARRALELDPGNVDALTALGAVYRDTLRWSEAEGVLERAWAIDPDSAELAEDYGEFLARTGRLDDLLEITSRGFAIDPYLSPLVEVHAVGLMGSGRNDEAADILRTSIASGSADYLYASLAASLITGGDEAGLRAVVLAADLPEDVRSTMLGALDRPDDPAAIRTLESYVLDPPESPVTSVLSEVLLLHIGQVDALVNSYIDLTTRFGSNYNDAIFLPAYTPVRQHPRFSEWLQVVGLPAYWDTTGWPEFCRRSEANIICE